MNETIKAVGWGGVSPDATVKAVLEALGAMYAVEQGTVRASHYVRFSNGLILQWGYGKTETRVTFPIAFTSVDSFGLGYCGNVQSGWWGYPQTVNIDETGFLPRIRSSETLNPGADAHWIAIGR